jgi:PAS domain S-box-containing protein
MSSAALEQELTQLRAENAELRTRLQEYQTIFDSMPIMLWHKDTESQIVHLNHAAAALEGKPKEAVEGKTDFDLYPKEQAEAFHKDDLQVIQSGTPKLNIIESHTAPATGETLWLQTGKVPYRDNDGKIVGVIAFAVDITEQKRIENTLRETHKELEKRNRQTQRVHEFFLSTLEHLMLSTSHGITQHELTAYLKDTRAQFERLDSVGQ